MKLIHLISGGDVGGAKTHVLSLLQGLNRTEDVHLICFMEGPFAEEARCLGIPTTVIEGSNPMAVRKRILAIIRHDDCQLLHCHGARANMIGALVQRQARIPVISTIHSDYRLDYLGRPLAALTYGNINKVALRRFDAWIGVSDGMRQLLISRGFDPQRIFPLYNGVDFSTPLKTVPRDEWLRGIGLTPTDKTVVFGIAARISPVKDMTTLVRAFAAAVKQAPDIRLVIAGDGEQAGEIRALAKELCPEGTVFFPGWLEDVNSFYQALDVNVLTSLSETFPYALTEGARFHLATVSTAVGGIPYLIDQDVNGYLFQPGDWQALGNDLAALGNDDELRRRLGEKLYEKASTQFSIQKTVSTQLQIYASILRRHRRRSSARDGVVICGAYGRGNAGDDAILEAILQEMRSIDPDMPITVLSKDPRSTRLTYRVRAVHRSNFLAWHTAMWNSRLYINGGGSLIQDVTSRRSLWFYLANIRAAKRAGNRVQMYGCGIGPVTRESHRSLAAKIINKYVDVITLREPDSLEELRAMGVTEPEVLLTADPALILQKAPDDETDSVLLRAGIPPHGNYLCFALRRWKGFEEKAPLFGAAAEYAYRTYGLTPVFVAVEKHLDPGAGQLAARGLTIPHYFLDDAGGAGTIIGALSRMQAVVSMRLHALIFAAGQGIPLAGVVYDPKVSAFLRYIGQEQFVDLAELTGQNLCAMIDQCVAQAAHPEAQAAAVRNLQAMEQKNVEVARRLLKG